MQTALDSSACETRLDAGYARFGPFVVDLRRRAVYKDGKVLDLCGQKYEVLLSFIEKGDAILTRNAVCERLWQSDTRRLKNVNGVISAVRRVLGDKGSEDMYIETVPREGYRLVSAVELSDMPPARPLPKIRSPSVERVVDTDSYIRCMRYTPLVAAGFLAIVSLIGLALLRSRRSESGLALIFLGGILLAAISNVSAHMAIRMSTKSRHVLTDGDGPHRKMRPKPV